MKKLLVTVIAMCFLLAMSFGAAFAVNTDNAAVHASTHNIGGWIDITDTPYISPTSEYYDVFIIGDTLQVGDKWVSSEIAVRSESEVHLYEHTYTQGRTYSFCPTDLILEGVEYAWHDIRQEIDFWGNGEKGVLTYDISFLNSSFPVLYYFFPTFWFGTGYRVSAYDATEKEIAGSVIVPPTNVIASLFASFKGDYSSFVITLTDEGWGGITFGEFYGKTDISFAYDIYGDDYIVPYTVFHKEFQRIGVSEGGELSAELLNGEHAFTYRVYVRPTGQAYSSTPTDDTDGNGTTPTDENGEDRITFGMWWNSWLDSMDNIALTVIICAGAVSLLAVVCLLIKKMR